MLECFKSKNSKGNIYYLNGTRVSKEVASAYAKANNKSLPSCVKKTQKTKLRSLSRSLKMYKSQTKEGVSQIGDLSSKNEKLLIDNSSLKSELDGFIELLDSIEDEVKVKSRVFLTNKRAEEMEEKYQKVVSDFKESTSKIEELNIDKSDKESLIIELNKTQQELLNDIRALNIDVESVKMQNDNLKEQVSNLLDVVEKNRKLEEIIEENKQLINEMRNETERYKETIEQQYNKERDLLERTQD